jgi:hypothetical protein
VPSNAGAACNDNNANTVNDICTSDGICQGVQATCGNTGVTCGSGFVRDDAATCAPGMNVIHYAYLAILQSRLTERHTLCIPQSY